ncbi:MAG TPA: hypothetical protein VJ327_11170 [Patescibacteria group bacterium]|nr:hypothetical protein [Patescibacteria group bacterium]
MTQEQADKIVKSINDLTITINSLVLSNQELIGHVLNPPHDPDGNSESVESSVDFDDDEKDKSEYYLDGTKVQ